MFEDQNVDFVAEPVDEFSEQNRNKALNTDFEDIIEILENDGNIEKKWWPFART